MGSRVLYALEFAQLTLRKIKQDAIRTGTSFSQKIQTASRNSDCKSNFRLQIEIQTASRKLLHQEQFTCIVVVVITILYRTFGQFLFFNLTYPFLLPNHVNNSSILPPKVGVFCSKRNIISSLRLWTAADFGQFFNISVLSLYKEFLDEMFLIVKFSYQSLWHDYFIVKFFVQRQYGDVEKLSKAAPLSKVTSVDGTPFSVIFGTKKRVSRFPDNNECNT